MLQPRNQQNPPSFFLSFLVANTQRIHWTKWVVSTQLITEETQNPRYKFKLDQNLNLNLFREIPRNLSLVDFSGAAFSVETVLFRSPSCPKDFSSMIKGDINRSKYLGKRADPRVTAKETSNVWKIQKVCIPSRARGPQGHYRKNFEHTKKT